MVNTNTSIEWTEVTWSPTTGCDKVSPGCDNCYALTLAKRLKGMELGRLAKNPGARTKYQNDGDPRTSGPGFLATEHEFELDAPLRWRKPVKVFVNSMSDLFHDRVSDEFIARVFVVMAATPRHTYQILTKRHGRMRALLASPEFQLLAGRAAYDFMQKRSLTAGWSWPLPNVWLGVSVEDQKWADIRIPALVDTPAAVRFLSCEPLLGPVDLRAWTVPDGTGTAPCVPDLNWMIVGGESGPGARPMGLAWAESLVDQCREARVPVHVKQLGSVWAQRTRRETGWAVDPKGGDWGFWPEHLRIREYPEVVR